MTARSLLRCRLRHIRPVKRLVHMALYANNKSAFAKARFRRNGRANYLNQHKTKRAPYFVITLDLKTLENRNLSKAGNNA